jgi:hypothetical protein
MQAVPGNAGLQRAPKSPVKCVADGKTATAALTLEWYEEAPMDSGD